MNITTLNNKGAQNLTHKKPISTYKAESPRLKIIPLGGNGEIGKNMMIYEYKDDIILVDCGMMFPRSEMLGIDFIIPNVSYLEKNKDKIRGLKI